MRDTLFKWVKVDLENMLNIPDDETDVFVRFIDAEGRASKGHGWIDTIDGSRRIRWNKEPTYPDRGGYALQFMQSLEFLEEIKQPPTNISKSGLQKFKEWFFHPDGLYMGSEVDDKITELLLEEIKQPIEEGNLLKAIKNEYADYRRIAELHMNENDAEIERLEKQLGEVTAGAAMNEQSLLELNRKIKENTIDKAITWLEKEKFDIPESDFEKTYNSTLHKAINYLESLK